MTVMSPADVSLAKEALEQDGYYVLRNVVSKDRLSELRELLLAEFERAK